MDKVATDRIIHHNQTNDYSLLIRELETGLLIFQWEESHHARQIEDEEIDKAKKAVSNYIKKHGPVFLLVDTYKGILINHDAQKRFQDKSFFEDINAIAVVLHSTTHRLSLNLSSQLNRTPIPIRGFTSQVNAQKWLKKQMLK